MAVCTACAALLGARGGRGRRPRYCSVTCRRSVELARRRWDAAQREADRWDRYAIELDGESRRAGSGFRRAMARDARAQATALRNAAGRRP